MNMLPVWVTDTATRRKILVENPARLMNSGRAYEGELPSQSPPTVLAARVKRRLFGRRPRSKRSDN